MILININIGWILLQKENICKYFDNIFISSACIIVHYIKRTANILGSPSNSLFSLRYLRFTSFRNTINGVLRDFMQFAATLYHNFVLLTFNTHLLLGLIRNILLLWNWSLVSSKIRLIATSFPQLVSRIYDIIQSLKNLLCIGNLYLR